MKDFIEILHVEGKESNLYYNRDKVFDGEIYRYRQPAGWIFMRVGDNYLYINYSNKNCGSLGSREYLTILSGGRNFQFNFGSMDDTSIEQKSIRDFECTDIGRTFYKMFGIRISVLTQLIRDEIDYAAYGY